MGSMDSDANANFSPVAVLLPAGPVSESGLSVLSGHLRLIYSPANRS